MVTAIDVGHFCRARGHCVAKTSDGPAVTSKPHTICNGCTRRIQEQLRQLPHLQDALQCFKAVPLTGEHGSKVNATPTPSVPINLTVVDLIAEIDRVILLAGGPSIRVNNLITEPAEDFVVWRGGRRCERQLDGVDRALAVGVVWRKADGIVGLSRQWVKRSAPCPRCGQNKLGMWSGENTVHCTASNCGEVFPFDRYQELCLAKAELEKLETKEKVR